MHSVDPPGFEILSPMHIRIPEFFRKNGNKDMIGVKKNGIIAMQSSNLFEYLANDPKCETIFASAMKI
jgi:hypothetical protein